MRDEEEITIEKNILKCLFLEEIISLEHDNIK